MRRLILPLFATLALLLALAWAFAPRPVAVETARIAPRDLAVEISEEGRARIREVFAVSAPISGRLERIALHAGDAVTAEETVVARIGPAAPELLDWRARAVAEAAAAAADAAVALARAELAQAEAEQEHAATEAERSRKLFERAAIPAQLRDNAILAERTAAAAVESARANLEVQERKRDSAEALLAIGNGSVPASCCVAVTAPVSGRILRVLTEDEQVVQAGTRILEIGDPGNLEIVADLLSRDAVEVVPGAAARITGWGGPELAATVERVEPAAETKVSALGIEEQRVEVILALTGGPEARAALGHGFRVNVHIRVWSGQDVLAVPVGALFRDGPDWAVFRVEDGRARLRRIVIGARSDAFAQVLDGLSAAEEVILHPADTVADGTKVVQAPS
ncbi:efflux RND transporter periplasmic adaptor subunit [Poseidonocella sp. HB161398]|uniref:efflux RND transporter periplasmic adaptor subunit n=1 Tax=Poseidonocella sp. HB161398 TaxID=2320855 RepID=UPI001107C382|nr:HlyD family efflux transporter periplasmic adaptor subunit [Poseidonocella sp. HB161398]